MTTYPNPIPKAHGIYLILNCVNGKFYIGCATYLRKRKAAHRCKLSKGQHHSEHLQRAWNKHGEQAFQFIVIEVVEDKDTLVAREQYYIDLLKPEYNNCPIAGTNRGRKLSPEHKEKLLAASRGRVVSPETRERIRQSLLGRPSPKSKEFGEKVRQRLLGQKHAPERVEKMRQSKLKRYREDPDLIERLRIAHLGQRPSAESRRKRSETMRRRIQEKRDSA